MVSCDLSQAGCCACRTQAGLTVKGWAQGAHSFAQDVLRQRGVGQPVLAARRGPWPGQRSPLLQPSTHCSPGCLGNVLAPNVVALAITGR